MSDGRPAAARSLLAEILDWMLAPLLMLWPISIAVTWLIAESIAGAPFDRALTQRVSVLARQVHGDGVQAVYRPALSDWLTDDPDDLVRFQLRDSAGRVVAGDPTLPLPPSARAPRPATYRTAAGTSAPALAPTFAAEPGLFRMDDVTVGGQTMRVAWTTTYAAPDHAPLLVQVAETLHKRSALANDIIKGVILPQLIILPVVILLVWFGLTRGLAPLHVLQHRIRQRRPDDRSLLAPGDAPAELAPLLASFNDLLQRLEANTLSQKRFIAQAAHQMKTPLAGLRMQAELALRQPASPDVQRSLEQIATSSRQAARLVTQLLSLARAEEASPLRETQRLDLAVLCRETVRDWAQAAVDKPIDLGYEGLDADVVVSGQPVLLREMLANLLDNAIRYTPAHGRVTVRLRPAGSSGTPPATKGSDISETTAMPDAFNPSNALKTAPPTDDAIIASGTPQVVIEVEDNGPGIPESEREHVLERFYRILGRSGDGSGLGLAIVNEIVALHGGQLSIGDHIDQDDPQRIGTLIRVTLPASNVAHGPAGPSNPVFP